MIILDSPVEYVYPANVNRDQKCPSIFPICSHPLPIRVDGTLLIFLCKKATTIVGILAIS